jgi:hypothetical protein
MNKMKDQGAMDQERPRSLSMSKGHLKARLQARGKRSMEAEAREMLRAALVEKDTPAVGFGTGSVALFRGGRATFDEPIQEWRGFPVEPIKFGR